MFEKRRQRLLKLPFPPKGTTTTVKFPGVSPCSSHSGSVASGLYPRCGRPLNPATAKKWSPTPDMNSYRVESMLVRESERTKRVASIIFHPNSPTLAVSYVNGDIHYILWPVEPVEHDNPSPEVLRAVALEQ